MPTHVSRCPVCNCERRKLIDQREFRGYPIENHVCAQCGVVFLSPRMTDAELAEFYRSDYRILYGGAENPQARDIARQQGRARSLVSFVQGLVSGDSRVLEIGASAGAVLAEMRARYGCTVVGVEPGDAFRAHASALGIRMVDSLDHLGDGTYDLIIMSHVLEHLADPVAYLSRLRSTFLATGGTILIEVPNVYCHESFEIAHLLSFSSRTLSQVFARSGFEVMRMEKHGRPVSNALPLYLTALARPAPARLRLVSDRNVRLKRWAGITRRKVVSRVLGRGAFTAG